MPKRYAFLDGIRAIAAFYVFLSHAYSLQFDARREYWLTALPFAFSDLAVVTFLVLSGFVLGLQMHKPQTFLSYIGRRSRRILPPYYGAIVVCLLLLILRQRSMGVDLLPDLTALAPNLLLVKDLYPDYSDWLIGSVVFWSIGLEYRLYWLLPVLAWCDRRWGVASVGALALVLTVAAFALLTALHLSTYRCWYIMLFAFGVMASQAAKMKVKTLLLSLSVFFVAVLAQSALFSPSVSDRMALDLSFGALMAVVMFSLVHSGDRPSTAKTFLSLQGFGWLAGWSYSLYLMHYALLRYSNFWLASHKIYGWSAIAFEVLPVAAGCWLFSQVFEQPFITKRVK